MKEPYSGKRSTHEFESYRVGKSSMRVSMPSGGWFIASRVGCKISGVLMVLWCVCAIPAESAGVQFALGLESTYVDWDRVSFEGNGVMYGPRLTLGIGSLNLTGRFIRGDFSIDAYEATATRQDIDAGISYTVFNHFSFCLLHKYLSYKLSLESSQQNETFSVFGVGVGSSWRLLQSNFFISGIAGYLPLIKGRQTIRFDSYKTTLSDDTSGLSADLSTGYAWSRVPLTGTIGVRYLRINRSQSDLLEQNTFCAIAVGLLYTL